MQQETAALSGEAAEVVGEERLPVCSEDGVDLTLIRWMLSLTPLERLRVMQQYAASAYRIQNAGKKLRL